jgi:Sulfotransferase domain
MISVKTRLPDFIIGGAPRAGTTWLYHLLDLHPEVHMAKPVKPEPKFFAVDELFNLGIEYYSLTWFDNLSLAKIVGEKSTNYLESPSAAARIHKHLPNVKLVFMLREPTDRAFSNYLWSRMNGHEEEDFATALALEQQRERSTPPALRYSRPHAYFARGLYADLLRPYFELFHHTRIICLRFEEIITNRHILAERLHRFLEVTPRPQDAQSLGVINSSEKVSGAMADTTRKDLKGRYSEPNRRLAKLLGPDFEIWS